MGNQGLTGERPTACPPILAVAGQDRNDVFAILWNPWDGAAPLHRSFLTQELCSIALVVRDYLRSEILGNL